MRRAAFFVVSEDWSFVAGIELLADGKSAVWID
jgi:hypothetical protein